MGYRGKLNEQQWARELRAQSWTLHEIARELGVSKGSVSVWVRDVDFEPRPRNRGHPSHRPHPLTVKKAAEIERCRVEAERWISSIPDGALTAFALALYAGEGAKADGPIVFANSDPTLIMVFLTWLRTEIGVDERRLRMRLYLHDDLDLEPALEFWSDRTGIPLSQFNTPIRPTARATVRRNRHRFGCAAVVYNSRSVHRRVMAMIEAITSEFVNPG